jgi:hypothetical protein
MEITKTKPMITDNQARLLYNRFERLRFGGNYQTRESIRKIDKAEPFNPERVRELFAKEHPQTQADWLRQIGYSQPSFNDWALHIHNSVK